MKTSPQMQRPSAGGSAASSRNRLIKLAQSQDKTPAAAFAKLAAKDRREDKNGNDFFSCEFKDETATRKAMIWSSNALIGEVDAWETGLVYRIEFEGEANPKFGPQITLRSVRPAVEGEDGYDIANFVQKSKYPPAELFASIEENVKKHVEEPKLRELVLGLIDQHRETLAVIPAAQSYHHAYAAGLLEHIRSMVRISIFIAEHYQKYYDKLNPPIDKGVLVAAAALHDIGKLKEFEFKNLDVAYSIDGSLIGHIVLGRDMVREAAARIEAFPPETLRRLEHAILAHHGQKEFGSPVEPQTIEALILHFIDDLDSKVNIVAGAMLKHDPRGGAFTERLGAISRRIYSPGALADEPAAEG